MKVSDHLVRGQHLLTTHNRKIQWRKLTFQTLHIFKTIDHHRINSNLKQYKKTQLFPKKIPDCKLIIGLFNSLFFVSL